MAEFTTRVRGLVRRTIPQNGYGFIISSAGDEVYFHHKDLRAVLERIEDARNIPLPRVGMQVEFVLAPAAKDSGTDFRAIDVTEV